MKKIKILLSYKGSVQNYIDALTGVGAEATAEYLPSVNTDFDGLILCGGGDIHPKFFNEENTKSTYIDEDRDRAELALLRAYVDAGKPVLGICRGHQLINVFFGGTLIQHIPKADLHVRKDGVDSLHTVSAEPDSILGKLYGGEFTVNSAHHQVLNKLGDGLRVTACWNNEYIEATEHTALPIFSVQWHPERISFSHKRKEAVDGAKIFEYFVDLCRKMSGK